MITGQGRAPRHFGMNKSSDLPLAAPHSNDIVLSSLDVSRHHARLEKAGDGWQIVDVSSRGGTFYNGRKLIAEKAEPWQPKLAAANWPLLFRVAAS